MSKNCYMCNGAATTYEHVPPKFLFPDNKDMPEGISLRKDLIKVPSCDLHNISNSKDDEYLSLRIMHEYWEQFCRISTFFQKGDACI